MGVPVATIVCEGRALDPAIELLAIEVHKQLDRVAQARLTLLDGSVAQQEFALSNSAFFEPGAKVRIDLGDAEDQAVQVFEGLVVRHAVQANGDHLALRVELRDAAFTLTRCRKSEVYTEELDSDVITKLIRDAGLRVGTIDATTITHKQLIQYYASDWDFICSRADVNGQVVLVDDGEISLRTLASSQDAAIKFEFGMDDIREFELELDGGEQWAKLTSQAWDLAQRKVADPVEGEPVELSAGNLDASAVANKLGGASYTLVLPAALAPEELAPWASARLVRSRLAGLRGRLVVAGVASLKPFDRIEIAGIGERFNGTVLVSAVTQHFDHDGWTTELQLGLSPDWYARTPDITDVAAGGLLPPVMGLQLGMVEAYEADPSGEQRIRVRLPALNGNQSAIWARMAWPDAGKDRGMVAWPEPEDEVVVGFLAGDPRQAVILGSLYGSVNTPPTIAGSPSEDNFKRAIVSKKGTTLIFDDEKVTLTLETPKHNKIIVDDDAEAITIEDQHGNVITLNSKGIKLESAADFAIKAAGKVVIEGSSVDVK